MLSVERYSKILSLLKTHQTMKVDQLGQILNVSENTVRRDLAHLEKKGMLTRVQGGATLGNLEKLIIPQEKNVPAFFDEKQAIAKMASSLIRPGSSVIIDTGSTPLALCSYLKNLSNLTVITNSLKVCNELVQSPPSSLIVSGGMFLESIQAFVGKPAESFFSSLHADLLFLGTKGISELSGLSIENFFETPVKQKMITAAEKVVLLADHSKFGRTALSQYAWLENIHVLVTDSKIEPRYRELIQSKGVEVLVAEI